MKGYNIFIKTQTLKPDATLLSTTRERARDWTLMPDVFMCIYMLVIGEGREGETETEV